MANLGSLTFGKVIGRFLAAVVDSPDDVDLTPDAVAIQGIVTFTPVPSVILLPNASTPTTILPAPIQATLDVDGDVSINGVKGVYLIASDGTGGGPSGFTYKVSFSNLTYNGVSVSYGTFNIYVGTNQVVDLSVVAPVNASAGQVTVPDYAGVAGLRTYVDGRFDSIGAGPGSGGSSIDDGDPSTTKVYSSSKTVQLITDSTASLTKSTVGLGNVDNTSDINKPVSTLTLNALSLKAPLASPTFTGTVSGITAAMVGLGNVDNTSDANKPVSAAQSTALGLKAPLASPAFTGTVTGITKAMVGLPNVDNTSDLNKPISTAQAAVNAAKADLVGGFIPSSQLPSLATSENYVVASQAAMLALTTTQVQKGDLAIRTDGAGTFILNGTDPSVLGNWVNLNSPTDVVSSVAGRQGIVVLTSTDVGLGNVNNTSDANKPVSTAQAAADTAVLNATVQLTGAQSIAGIKTFTSAPVVPANSFPESAITGLTTDLTAKVSSTRLVSTGTGLTGGGDLSADRTLALANTAVTPGVYTNANITIDAQGRITAAANGTAGTGGSSAVAPTITTIAYATTVTPNAAAGQVQRMTLTGDSTVNAPTNPVEGQPLQFEFSASGAARTVTLQTGVNASFKFGTDITTLPLIAAGTTLIVLATFHSSSSRWWVTTVLGGY